MVPVAAPAARRVELVLADLVRSKRGGPCVAAEEGGEMGGPATGGADGPELPHLVVLEVGVADISQGRLLGAERARRRCRRVGGTGGAGRAGLVRGHGIGPSFAVAAGGRPSVHIRSGGRDREAECGGATGSRDDRWGRIDRSVRIGGSDGCRRRPAAGGGRVTGHHERNHQGRDNQLLQRPPPPVNPDADVERRERLGGLLSFYYREAARGRG